MRIKHSSHLTIIILFTALPISMILAESPSSNVLKVRFQELVEFMGCSYIDEKIFLNGQLVWEAESRKLEHKTEDMFPIERPYFRPSFHGTGSNPLGLVAYTRISVNQAEAVFGLYTRSGPKEEWKYGGTMTISSKNNLLTEARFSGVSNPNNDTISLVMMFMLMMFGS